MKFIGHQITQFKEILFKTYYNKVDKNQRQRDNLKKKQQEKKSLKLTWEPL